MARDRSVGGFNSLNNDSKDKHTHMDFDDTASNVDDTEEFEEENKEVESLEENEPKNNEVTKQEKKENVQTLLGEEEKSEKVLRGFYLEPHINKAIDEATEDKKRGARTKLVNLLLEQALEENNLL